jgi:hypothetical protein
MKKLALALVLLAGLAACSGYQDSPEKKAFDQFLAQCKATPDTPDCVAFKKSLQGDGGHKQ